MLGTIHVIFAKPSDVGVSSSVMSVVRGPDVKARDQAPKITKVMATPTLVFSKEDKEGTFSYMMLLWWLP